VAHVLLRDGLNDIECHSLSQAVQVEFEYVAKCQTQTPADYAHAATGYALTYMFLFLNFRFLSRKLHSMVVPVRSGAYVSAPCRRRTVHPHINTRGVGAVTLAYRSDHPATPLLHCRCGEAIKLSKPHLDHHDWHSASCGLSRQQLLHVAVRCVLGQYRRIRAVASRTAASSLAAIAT
jgi:hypothetical protein